MKDIIFIVKKNKMEKLDTKEKNNLKEEKYERNEYIESLLMREKEKYREAIDN